MGTPGGGGAELREEPDELNVFDTRKTIGDSV